MSQQRLTDRELVEEVTLTGQIHVVEDGTSKRATISQVKTALEIPSTTSDIAEGTNLYYTDARVADNSAVAANTAKRSYPEADETKLATIEEGATTDQTAEEIKTAYESNADTNAYTDAEKSKLTGIEAGAEVNTVVPADIENFETTTELNTRDTANRNTDNHTDGTINKVFTATEQTKLGTIETNATADQDSNTVIAERIAGSTYSTVQHMQDLFHSSGWTSGGVITDNFDGSVAVSAGTGLIRATDSDIAVILFTDFAAVNPLALTDDANNYIYVEYNAGTPRVIATTVERTDYNTNFAIGVVYREGTSLHINPYEIIAVSDHAAKMIRFNQEVMPYARVSGGAISETGTRNIALTAGTFWEGLSRFTTDAFNSSGADRFTYFYRDGIGGWTEQAAQSQINNSQWDDNSGTLAALIGVRYGVHWVYLETDGDIGVVFGRGNYTLAQAQDATPPVDIPPIIASHGFLAGKIIIQNGAVIFTQLESAFMMQFNPASVTEHNTLSGLQGGTAGEYYHLTSAQTTVVENTSGTNSGDEASASTTVEGVVELATDAETKTGTDTARAVTPAGLTSIINDTIVGYLLTSEASSATPTITGTALRNDYVATALDVNTVLAEPSGTANASAVLRYRITASGGTRTVGYDATLLAGNVTRTESLDAGETLSQIYQRVGSAYVCVFDEVTS